MGRTGFNFDLLDQLTFYGSYHNNKWNQLIHVIFVPLIFWSGAVWLAYTGPLVPLDLSAHLDLLPVDISRFCVLNGASVLLGAYTLYYLTLEPFAGLTWGLVLGLPIWITATAFAQLVPHAWAWALLVHVGSWYMQIHPGHMVLEQRRPALLDSFFQSLVLAPLFVWMEVLFQLGYRKQLFAQLKARVEANIAQFRQQTASLLSKEVVADADTSTKS